MAGLINCVLYKPEDLSLNSELCKKLGFLVGTCHPSWERGERLIPGAHWLTDELRVQQETLPQNTSGGGGLAEKDTRS